MTPVCARSAWSADRTHDCDSGGGGVAGGSDSGGRIAGCSASGGGGSSGGGLRSSGMRIPADVGASFSLRPLLLQPSLIPPSFASPRAQPTQDNSEQPLGSPCLTVLGCIVRRLVRRGHKRVHAASIDDAAPPGGAHVRQRRLAGVERGRQAHCQHVVPLVLRELRHRAHKLDARIVDCACDAAAAAVAQASAHQPRACPAWRAAAPRRKQAHTRLPQSSLPNNNPKT
eukprot:53280-Chlamydomonas_euryale.AAC.2